MGLQGMLNQASGSPAGAVAATLLLILGAIAALRALARLASGVYIYFLRPGKDVRRLGQWALVTGATDGIGKAYAAALAKKGLNVLLVSRTQAKLDEVATELASKYKVQTETAALDFGGADAAAWEHVKAKVDALEVGILVNNVGMSYPHAEYFDKIPDELIDSLIQLNIASTNKMTRLVLPGMKARKRGAIVNIGSAVATIAPSGPLYTVYAATKMYVDMFSKSLDLECRGGGITVQNMAPGFVATKLAKIRHASLEAPSPATWAAAAVRHIGYEVTSSPYWFHALQWAVVSSAPRPLIDFYILSLHRGLRDKYYAKVARAAKAAAPAAGNGHADAKGAKAQ